MYIGNNNCDPEYDPGFGMTGGSDTRANSITAWILPNKMLPNGLAESDAPFAIGKGRFVRPRPTTATAASGRDRPLSLASDMT
jgi:hypothetical protein